MTLKAATSKYYWIVLILFLVGAYFPLFLKLSGAPIRQWDESLFALRAYQVANKGQLLFNFDEIPGGLTHTNGKPPLITLVQAASFKVLGYNELALRLPIAFLALATVLYLLYFFKRHFNAPWQGLLTGAVLLTTSGYIHDHAARTGDQDVALAFFVLLAICNFYLYLQNTEQRRYLFLFVLSITAGFLTKSVVVLFTAPAWLLYAIYKKKLKFLITSKYTYLAALFFVAAVIAVYLGIELMHGGYLKHVWEHEIGGRYSNTIHGHVGAWYYYFHQLWHFQFMPWVLLLPVFFVLLLRGHFGKQKDLLLLVAMAAMVHLAVVSSAQTKLAWYLVGALPLLAIMSAAVLNVGLKALWGRLSYKGSAFQAVALTVIVLLVLIYPYVSTIYRVGDVKPGHYEEHACDLMKRMRVDYPELKRYSLLDKTFFSGPLFYMNAWNDHDGFNVERVVWPSVNGFSEGDVIVLCNDVDKKWLNEHFEYSIMMEDLPCQTVRVLGAVQLNGAETLSEDEGESIL